MSATSAPERYQECAGEWRRRTYIIQVIEGRVLNPFVMMRSVKLNPLIVVIAELLGTALLGIIGGILAAPADAVVEVVIWPG